MPVTLETNSESAEIVNRKAAAAHMTPAAYVKQLLEFITPKLKRKMIHKSDMKYTRMISTLQLQCSPLIPICQLMSEL